MGDEGVAESTAKLYVPKAQYDAKVASLRAEVAMMTEFAKTQQQLAADLENTLVKENAALIEARGEVGRLQSAREHTQDWYARHYGKLEDWARKRLPDPWCTEFFNCVANGTWGHDDIGEPYMSQVGRIVPGGYFKMDTASEQLLRDQTTRAEQAEEEVELLHQANKEHLVIAEKLNSECQRNEYLAEQVARLEKERDEAQRAK